MHFFKNNASCTALVNNNVHSISKWANVEVGGNDFTWKFQGKAGHLDLIIISFFTTRPVSIIPIIHLFPSSKVRFPNTQKRNPWAIYFSIDLSVQWVHFRWEHEKFSELWVWLSRRPPLMTWQLGHFRLGVLFQVESSLATASVRTRKKFHNTGSRWHPSLTTPQHFHSEFFPGRHDIHSRDHRRGTNGCER